MKKRNIDGYINLIQVDFNTKTITGNEEDHFITIKESVYQEEKTIYVSNTELPKRWTKKLTEMLGEVEKSTIMNNLRESQTWRFLEKLFFPSKRKQIWLALRFFHFFTHLLCNLMSSPHTANHTPLDFGQPLSA